jgi:hypothetical protein
MKVGDVVWKFDPNHYVYVDDNGVRHKSPIYRKHFVKHYIIGETKVSWIISRFKDIDIENGIKIKKKEAERILYTSEEEIDKHCWVIENRIKISDAVRMCYDYDTMKKTAELLNLELD